MFTPDMPCSTDILRVAQRSHVLAPCPSVSPSLALCPPNMLTLALTPAQNVRAHSLTHAHFNTHSLALTVALQHTHSLSITRSLSVTHTHTRNHTRSHAQTHAYTHTEITRTLTRTLIVSHSHVHSYSHSHLCTLPLTHNLCFSHIHITSCTHCGTHMHTPLTMTWRRESSKRNYYIISPRVIIKAIIITSNQTHTRMQTIFVSLTIPSTHTYTFSEIWGILHHWWSPCLSMYWTWHCLLLQLRQSSKSVVWT